jgi:hypothetical protein
LLSTCKHLQVGREFKNDMHTDTYIAGNKLEATRAFKNSTPHLYSIFYGTHDSLRNSSQGLSSQSVMHIIPPDRHTVPRSA